MCVLRITPRQILDYLTCMVQPCVLQMNDIRPATNYNLRLQMILLYRLLLNLRDASSKDIHIGTQYSSSEDESWNPNTTEAQSSIKFNHTGGTDHEGSGMLNPVPNHSSSINY